MQSEDTIPIYTDLLAFDPISLAEMDRVKLMDRFDFKLIFTLDKLHTILNKLLPHYRVLEVKGNRLSSYDNTYFDTPERDFFLQHHNKKANRLKVRYRAYVESEITFFEVKQKNNKGKTIKERISVAGSTPVLGADEKLLLQNFIPERIIDVLMPTLNNSFKRLTLVNKSFTDRLTFDLFTSFDYDNKKAEINHLVIAELKQSAHVLDPFKRQLFKDERIYPVSISKYIIGSLLIDPTLKYNNFKEKLLFINKLKHVA
ncbi:MAG: polyphosphate polymerase domain-containing protein [Bacteroidota bacterium]